LAWGNSNTKRNQPATSNINNHWGQQKQHPARAPKTYNISKSNTGAGYRVRLIAPAHKSLILFLLTNLTV